MTNERLKEEKLIGLNTGIIRNKKNAITIEFDKTNDVMNVGESFYWYGNGKISLIEIVDIQIIINKNTFMILYVDEDNNKYNSRDSFFNLQELQEEIGDCIKEEEIE